MPGYDFPNAPANGQIITGSTGASYRWDGTKWVATGGAGGGIAAMHDVGRNLIHNAGFTVAQRTGPWTALGYTLDRWLISLTLDTVSISQAALADADRTAIGDEEASVALQNVFVGNAGASANNVLAQRLENVRRFAGKTITLSLWAKAASGTPKLGFNIAQNFGTGGSPSAGVTALATGNSVTLSTAWTRYSTTIAVPSIAGKTLGTNNDHFTAAQIWYSSGATSNATAGNIGVQSGTIQLWGVQLEIGSVATPLDYGGSPQQVLAQCQRFYSTGFAMWTGYGAAGGNIGYAGTLPCTMRAAPTMALSGQVYGNASAATISFTNTTTFNFYAVATAAGYANVTANYTASADL